MTDTELAWQNIENAEAEFLRNLADNGGLAPDLSGMLRHCARLLDRAVAEECGQDATDLEVVQDFLHIARTMRPVGQWPGERLWLAVDRLINRPIQKGEDQALPPLRGQQETIVRGPSSQQPLWAFIADWDGKHFVTRDPIGPLNDHVSEHVRKLVGKLDQWRMCMSHSESYVGEPAGLFKEAIQSLARAVNPIYPEPKTENPFPGVVIYTVDHPEGGSASDLLGKRGATP